MKLLIAIYKNEDARAFRYKDEIVLPDTRSPSSELVLEYIEETGWAEVFSNKP